MTAAWSNKPRAFTCTSLQGQQRFAARIWVYSRLTCGCSVALCEPTLGVNDVVLAAKSTVHLAAPRATFGGFVCNDRGRRMIAPSEYAAGSCQLCVGSRARHALLANRQAGASPRRCARRGGRCRIIDVLKQHPDIKILSDDQNAEGSRDGGLKVFQSLLTRFDKIDAVFAINDPTAIGAELAARQLKRSDFIITAVDGAPDIEKEFSSGTSLIKASASQDPYVMAGQSLQMAAQVLAGKKPAESVVLLDPKLITAENLKDYKGWTAAR